MIVNVWDWHNNIKVASNKISTKVKAISFAENGNYFVTGNNIVFPLLTILFHEIFFKKQFRI